MRIKKNKKKLIIIGGEGVGEIAANIAEQNNQFEKIYFLNDENKNTIGKKKYKVIGKTSSYKKYLVDSNYFFFYAIIEYKKQKNRADKFKKIPKKKYVNIIHKNSNFDRKIIENKKNILICCNVNISK